MSNRLSDEYPQSEFDDNRRPFSPSEKRDNVGSYESNPMNEEGFVDSPVPEPKNNTPVETEAKFQ